MGKPAARVGDAHSCPMKEITVAHGGGPILEGSPNVFIGGMPAARVGDKVHCNGPVDMIVEGEPSVFINGRPAARMGDKTAHGGVIVAGCPTVFVGTSALGRCAEEAAAAGSPFIVSEK
ncbi:type VI secretion protein [Geomonas silvestris]|uniref:Type VI secretion protein n=1 Tax=Geomonas silvestris TaxID=2740184 RepID=A0A6V8MER3_9BACT|nr:PAAR domain-containing protein [Geomonas silvestris]GFO58412.1 type VI secretion protein [Geomonas silvestris]